MAKPSPSIILGANLSLKLYSHLNLLSELKNEERSPTTIVPQLVRNSSYISFNQLFFFFENKWLFQGMIQILNKTENIIVLVKAIFMIV